MPPSLHFETPNPEIDFATSPFYVNTAAAALGATDGAAPGGVSSFGIGGTNAHVVLEEAPAVERRRRRRGPGSCCRSRRERRRRSTMPPPSSARLPDARTPTATSPTWRSRCRSADRAFRTVARCVCRDAATTPSLALSRRRIADRSWTRRRPSRVVFLFPGQGAQYVGMAPRALRREPAFRAEIDRCADLLAADLDGHDLRALLSARRRRRRRRCLRRDWVDAAGAVRRRVRAGAAVAAWGIARRPCSGTASANTWRPASPASSRSRTRCGWWRCAAG